MRISPAQDEDVQFVRTDEVGDWSQPLDITAPVVAQPDQGPDPSRSFAKRTMTLPVG
jgi:hypothetical protein